MYFQMETLCSKNVAAPNVIQKCDAKYAALKVLSTYTALHKMLGAKLEVQICSQKCAAQNVQNIT